MKKEIIPKKQKIPNKTVIIIFNNIKTHYAITAKYNVAARYSQK